MRKESLNYFIFSERRVYEDFSHLLHIDNAFDRLLVFQVFCALAEHERNVIVQRTRAAWSRPKRLAVKYQKIAPAVKHLY